MGRCPAKRGVEEEVALPHPPLRLFDSPCKSVCRIDDRFDWCIGCKRTRAEIKAWPTAGEGEKKEILDRLKARAESEAGLLAVYAKRVR
jgi:predicted Fe-S protein YdhL (DUF1289 family)